MGLILADNKKISLGELSTPRALSAMPFGGRYRIIDFMLSDMVNSGIKNVGLLTYNKYKSLMDHTGTGAAWSLDRKNDGLHILPPYVNSEASSTISDEELTGVMDFLRQSRSTYVIVAGSNIILNTTFDDFIRSHEASGADISVMYNRDGTKYGNPSYILDIDEDGFVRDMLFNPPKAASSKCSLGILCLRRDLLIDIIAKQMAHGTTHFGKGLRLRVFGRGTQDQQRTVLLQLFDVTSYGFRQEQPVLERQPRIYKGQGRSSYALLRQCRYERFDRIRRLPYLR